MSAEEPAAVRLPEGDYAIVEQLGHRTFVGRVLEIERFGTKMLQIEPIFAGALLGPMMIGGGSIFAFTPCTAEVAAKRGAKRLYELPASVAAMVPPALLPPPEPAPAFAPYFLDEDDERGPR